MKILELFRLWHRANRYRIIQDRGGISYVLSAVAVLIKQVFYTSSENKLAKPVKFMHSNRRPGFIIILKGSKNSLSGEM
jgi:hypothetical protein